MPDSALTCPQPLSRIGGADAAAGGVLTIDLGVIEGNWRHLSALSGGAVTAGVVKADAYGLGARPVAKVLLKAGCKAFFVAQLSEALDLRPCIPDNVGLYVLNGLAPGSEGIAAAANVVPVANSLDQLVAWGRLARDLGRVLPVVIQVDSGMSRLGLSPVEVDQLAATPELLAGLELKLVMSHLACGDEPEHPANAFQLANFRSARAKLPPAPASLANSAGIFLGRDYQFDLCRPGAALYGLNVGPRAHGIRPVVQLSARVAQLREIPAGAHVGYGWSFQADKPLRLATVSVGYADGWPRHLSGVGAAWCDGVRLPIVGRVSMDSFTCDVSALPEGRLSGGALVDLIGPDSEADAVAGLAGTIGYEVLTRLGQRYARVYR